MHVVLAAHPAAAPPLALLAGVLDHGYSTKELRRQTMDDVLRQIDEGFRLARELMEELPAAQNEPTYLADRCHGIVQAYVAAIRMLHPHGGTEDASSSPPPLRPPHPPPHFGGDGSGSGQHDHVIPQLDLLRPFLGGAPSPSAPSSFPHNLGRLLAESSFINTAPVVDAFGAGSSSGGPVRRQASSSRSSPPVQPRQQHRRRYVRALPFLRSPAWRTLGVLAACCSLCFGGQEFKPGLAERRPFTTSWHGIFHASTWYLFSDCDAPEYVLRAESRGVIHKLHEGLLED